MSAYKSFLGAAKAYLESIPFLKFLLTYHIFVFALGGVIFALGGFVWSLYDAFTCIGGILVFAGLLLTLVSEDAFGLLIASGAVSLISLIAWIVGLATSPLAGYFFGGFALFRYQPFFYFLIFGTIALLTLLKSDKLKQMRADAAAKSAIPCARCGSPIPKTAAFCPACGAPAPVQPAPQYAAPAQPAPQYAAPAQPAPQHAAPAQPEPQYAAPVKPAASIPPAETVVSAASERTAKFCAGCGASLPADAAFCAKCGAKQ